MKPHFLRHLHHYKWLKKSLLKPKWIVIVSNNHYWYLNTSIAKTLKKKQPSCLSLKQTPKSPKLINPRQTQSLGSGMTVSNNLTSL